MNEQKYELKMSLPKRLARLVHENHTVKMTAALAYLVAIIAVAGVVMTSGRPPTVITLDADGNKVNYVRKVEHTTRNVEEAIREYVKYRYTWAQERQIENLKQAREFVASSAFASFSKVAVELLKFSKEKQISQRVYVTDLSIDQKENIVRIKADRFDEIQGLRAASILDVKLSYEEGAPTVENPWGVYISKEEEIATR